MKGMVQDGERLIPRLGRGRRQVVSTATVQTTTVPGSMTSFSTPSPSITILPISDLKNHSSHGQLITSGESPPASYCTVALPSGGLIQLNDSTTFQLDDNVSFEAPCGNNSIFNSGSEYSSVIAGQPFYASIAPQVYVLAATTIISYFLVLILFITPRTFYIGGPTGSATSLGGGSGLLGRGITFMGTGSSTSGAVGIGRRPLLQKIATITVAISLTIATSDTFNVAANQYAHGYMDPKTLVEEVVGSEEIRVTRVISDAFLWLAQVQTLIRLFPRHKEKVTIKWLGFGLITCDIVFSILENFVSKSNRTRPESFRDAIPALSYLFELSISLIYASCVVYYALSKRRFAFWHPKMRNVCLVALMSLIAILIPVVFFIVDVAQPEIATWGEYIRWVGAAAASVVVWEWVERIEALERDEKKDGILGREIFDGDEMIDLSRSSDNDFGRSSDSLNHNSKTLKAKEESQTMAKIKKLNVRPRIPFKMRRKGLSGTKTTETAPVAVVNGVITRPAQAATPISRSDTNSAASTVYAVRYHHVLSPSPAIPENDVVYIQPHEVDPTKEIADDSFPANMNTITEQQEELITDRRDEEVTGKDVSHGQHIWHHVANPFKRKRAEPPAEVAAQVTESNLRRSPAIASFSLKTKFNAFASTQKDKFSGRSKNRTPLQVTVIPAKPRGSRAGNATDSGVQSFVEDEFDAAQASGTETPRQGSLPVTIIPPPVKGGRTWSPDDMIDTPVQDRHGSNSTSSSNSQLRIADQQNSPAPPSRTAISSIRATPPARASPNRSANNSAARSFLRGVDSGRSRAATAVSMNERLNGSPVTVGGGISSDRSQTNMETGVGRKSTPSPPSTSQQTADAANPPDPTPGEYQLPSISSNFSPHANIGKESQPTTEGHQPIPSSSGPGRPSDT